MTGFEKFSGKFLNFFEDVSILCMKNKKHMKTIAYFHGYNSSGSTGRRLQKMLEGKYNVLAPSLSKNADEAIELAQKLVDENDVALIIGSSLGGFVSLNVRAPYKVIINPTLEPSTTLPLIDCPQEIASSYEKYEKRFRTLIDDKEREHTFGFFGLKDNLVHYQQEFEQLFGQDHVSVIPDGEHKVSETDLRDFVIPMIDKILSTKG